MKDKIENRSFRARRDFLSQLGVGLALALPVTLITQAFLGKKAFASDDMADEKDPVAMAIGYTCPASKVDIKKWPKRAGADGAQQFCWNCVLYQAKDPKNPKADAKAPCPLLAMKNVLADCWCNSWALNQNIRT